MNNFSGRESEIRGLFKGGEFFFLKILFNVDEKVHLENAHCEDEDILEESHDVIT